MAATGPQHQNPLLLECERLIADFNKKQENRKKNQRDHSYLEKVLQFKETAKFESFLTNLAKKVNSLNVRAITHHQPIFYNLKAFICNQLETEKEMQQVFLQGLNIQSPPTPYPRFIPALLAPPSITQVIGNFLNTRDKFRLKETCSLAHTSISVDLSYLTLLRLPRQKKKALKIIQDHFHQINVFYSHVNDYQNIERNLPLQNLLCHCHLIIILNDRNTLKEEDIITQSEFLLQNIFLVPGVNTDTFKTRHLASIENKKSSVQKWHDNYPIKALSIAERIQKINSKATIVMQKLVTLKERFKDKQMLQDHFSNISSIDRFSNHADVKMKNEAIVYLLHNQERPINFIIKEIGSIFKRNPKTLFTELCHLANHSENEKPYHQLKKGKSFLNKISAETQGRLHFYLLTKDQQLLLLQSYIYEKKSN